MNNSAPSTVEPNLYTLIIAVDSGTPPTAYILAGDAAIGEDQAAPSKALKDLDIPGLEHLRLGLYRLVVEAKDSALTVLEIHRWVPATGQTFLNARDMSGVIGYARDLRKREPTLMRVGTAVIERLSTIMESLAVTAILNHEELLHARWAAEDGSWNYDMAGAHLGYPVLVAAYNTYYAEGAARGIGRQVQVFQSSSPNGLEIQKIKATHNREPTYQDWKGDYISTHWVPYAWKHIDSAPPLPVSVHLEHHAEQPTSGVHYRADALVKDAPEHP